MKTCRSLQLNLWSARVLRLVVALCASLIAACGGGYGGGSSAMGGGGYGMGGTTPPTITSVTVTPSQMVTAGTMVTFTVTATGTATLMYQWSFNGTTNPITGATMATYVIPSAKTTNSGSYAVVVTNNYGSKTSSPITLTVM